MSSKCDDILACLERKVPKRLPVCPLTPAFDAAYSGLTYAEYSSDAKTMANAVITCAVENDFHWMRFPADEVIELEPFGIKPGPEPLEEAVVPWSPLHTSALPADRKTLKELEIPDPHQSGRMPIRLDAIRTTSDQFSREFCIVGYLAGPLTCTCHLFGPDTALMMMYDDPDLICDTVDFFTEMQIVHGNAQIDAGAQGIFIGDLFSASNFISTEFYENFSFPFLKRLIGAYNRTGAFTVYHPNEHRLDHLCRMARLADAGDVALTVGDRGDIRSVKKMIGDEICLFGGIDPLTVLRNETPERIDAIVRGIVTEVSIQGGHILGTGAMVAVDTPVEHMRTFVNAAKKYWPFEKGVKR